MTAPLWKLGSALLVVMSTVAVAAQNNHAFIVGANYTYVRTNLVPGCSCFSLNGGGVQAQIELTSHWATAGDLTLTHRSSITPDNYVLSQLTYTGGVRLRPLTTRARFQPFGEVMLGGASTFGSLSPSRTGVGTGSNAFAFQPGGGLEVRLGSRVRLVPVETDYLMTTFSNAANNRQNDLRLGSGILIRLTH